MSYDLEERTTAYAKKIVHHCGRESVNVITRPIIDQLIRSASSIGANYREANGAESRKDFRSKIGICKKESKETMYWIEILATVSNKRQELRTLWKEAHELTLIFARIAITLREKNNDK